MLAPEPYVLDGRQAFDDAQRLFAGATVPLGFFEVAWYGSATQDERGCFAVVDPMMGLADMVGDILEVTFYPQISGPSMTRSARVYVIGSQQDLGSDLAVTRRTYMTLQVLAIEPITARIGLVQ